MTETEKKSSDRMTYDEAARFLSGRGWLAELPDSARRLILEASRLVRFSGDETVYHMGDAADGLYGFVTGGLRVLLPGDDGETLTMHVTEPGFWVGDSAFFSTTRRLVSLVTTRPTVGLHLNQPSLRDLTERAPHLYPHFYTLSHRNLATALRLLAHLSVANSHRRIALRLLYYDEISREPDGWLHMNQEEMTRLVAVSLPTVQRALRRFAAAGAVELGYRKMRVIDRKALIALSGEETRASDVTS